MDMSVLIILAVVVLLVVAGVVIGIIALTQGVRRDGRD